MYTENRMYLNMNVVIVVVFYAHNIIIHLSWRGTTLEVRLSNT